MRFLPLLGVLIAIVVLMGSLGSGSISRGLKGGRTIVLVAAGSIAAILLLWLIAAGER